VIITTDEAEAVTPISPEHDQPDSVDDLFGWLRAAGLQPSVVWGWKDLAVIAAEIGRGPRQLQVRAEPEPWLVINPKPVVGERELDGVGLLRNAVSGGESPIESARRMLKALW
jgi:hypothetical protein